MDSESSSSHYRKSSKSRSPKHLKLNFKSDSDSFDQSQCRSQNKELLNYFNKKVCEICDDSSKSTDMLLCDKCEDGYHLQCLKMKESMVGEIWICPRCVYEEKQAKKAIKFINLEPQVQMTCAKCSQSLDQSPICQSYYFPSKEVPKKFENIKTLKFSKEFQNIRCLYCKQWFHSTCFSIRKNALNCFKCQKQIRARCPKGHKEYLEYYRRNAEVYKKQKYLTLTPLPIDKRQNPAKRYSRIGFKLPSPATSWQLITQFQSSVFYAFETKRLYFTEQQIYDSFQTMDLNRWNGDSMSILELHQDDERTFEHFKSDKTIVGKYEIKQQRGKGFFVVATDFIEKLTIITEYVGQVVSSRKSLFHHEQNDSIFILVRNVQSTKSLDIVPHHFGNIGRFFSGINNQVKGSRKLLNVEVKRFSYKGRVRIIFYASKDIQAGDELYFDYNGGPVHEYPTENFK